MAWVKTTHTFKNHGIIFVIPARDTVRHTQLLDYCLVEKPEILEGYLREVILEYRPELKGMNIHALEFRLDHNQWWIGVTHESLPEKEDAEMLDMWWVDKERQGITPYQR